MKAIAEKLSPVFRALDYVIVLLCSLQIAGVPVVLFGAFTTVQLSAASWWTAWALSYAVVAMIAINLSHVRFGVVVVLVATAFAFAVTERAISQLHQKHSEHERR